MIGRVGQRVCSKALFLNWTVLYYIAAIFWSMSLQFKIATFSDSWGHEVKKGQKGLTNECTNLLVKVLLLSLFTAQHLKGCPISRCREYMQTHSLALNSTSHSQVNLTHAHLIHIFRSHCLSDPILHFRNWRESQSALCRVRIVFMMEHKYPNNNIFRRVSMIDSTLWIMASRGGVQQQHWKPREACPTLWQQSIRSHTLSAFIDKAS